MSKKVFLWMLADTAFGGVITLIVTLIRNGICSAVGEGIVSSVIFWVFTALYIVIDAVILIFFLYYWWCDKEWTRIKNNWCGGGGGPSIGGWHEW